MCSESSGGTCLFINHIRTGIHSVADVFCIGCDERLGWFYHKAADLSQKYKEGIYTLLLLLLSLLAYWILTRKISSRAREACKRECVEFGGLGPCYCWLIPILTTLKYVCYHIIQNKTCRKNSCQMSFLQVIRPTHKDPRYIVRYPAF